MRCKVTVGSMAFNCSSVVMVTVISSLLRSALLSHRVSVGAQDHPVGIPCHDPSCQGPKALPALSLTELRRSHTLTVGVSEDSKFSSQGCQQDQVRYILVARVANLRLLPIWNSTALPADAEKAAGSYGGGVQPATGRAARHSELSSCRCNS